MVGAKTQDLDWIVERCRRGDDRAWGQLIDRFQALVYSIPRRYGLSEDDAADVFQITFSRLLKSFDKIESGYVLPRWLGLTASRESLKLLRIRGRTASYESSGITLEELVDEEERAAESNALMAERAIELRDALASLGGKCGDLLRLLYLEEDLGYTEVAARLKMPMGTIGPTRTRCLEKLQAVLAKSGFFG